MAVRSRNRRDAQASWCLRGHFSLEGDMALQLTSPVFEQGGEIPKRYTCDGDDVSPPLRWRGTPDGTQSFVLLCNDPGAPGGTFRHWAAYDIPGEWVELAGRARRRESGRRLQAGDQRFRQAGPWRACPPRRMARTTIISA
jgi:Raf kinase inhibitor-like YbhB/YbcL family protein